MTLMDSLERRLGRFAIPGLIKGIVLLNALVFVLGKLNPGFTSYLDLSINGIEHGQYWRLVTYILIPRTESYLWILFSLGFLWWTGNGLEQAWGAFRLNLYYLIGMIGTTAAALVFGAEFSNSLLNLSVMFAFATLFPDEIIYVQMLLPVKIKWLALFYAALLVYQGLSFGGEYWMALLAALANYLLFFGPEFIRTTRQAQQVQTRRRKFADTSVPADQPLHCCAVCGRTERTNPEVEFRVSNLTGDDYCREHLPKGPAA